MGAKRDASLTVERYAKEIPHGRSQRGEAATTRAAFRVGVYRLSVGLRPELGIAQRYAEVREGKGLKFVGNVVDTIFKVDQ
jgi:hypothetical protein